MELNKGQGENRQNQGYILILMAGILWGSIGIFVNLLKEMGVDTATIAFLRLFCGWSLLLPILLVLYGRKAFAVDKTTLFYCVLSGLFSQALFNFSYNVSIEKVGMATGCILLYTAPIFVTLMSRMVFGEEIGARKLAALAVNVAGCILTVTGGNFSEVRFSAVGVAAGIAAGFFYALMTIFGQKMSGKCLPLTITFYSFLTGWAVMLFLARPWQCEALAAALQFKGTDSPVLLLTALGYGLIPTVGSYFCYMKGFSMNLETSKVPVVASVETVVAAFAALLLFQEPLGAGKVAGIALVLASIAIMNAEGKQTGGKSVDKKA